MHEPRVFKGHSKHLSPYIARTRESSRRVTWEFQVRRYIHGALVRSRKYLICGTTVYKQK